MKISVSYLASRDISRTISELDKTDVDFIHVDVMDGKYVKNKSISFKEVSNIGYYTKKRLDVHFMVNKPLKYIDDYASLNVFCMCFHLNIKNNLEEVIERTKLYGIKVGLVLNPSDDIELLDPYLDKIDVILVMSVVPGKPGQTFMEEVIPKINKLKAKLRKEKRNILISVDGGINCENVSKLKNADIIVSGSFVTNSNNYQDAITSLRK